MVEVGSISAAVELDITKFDESMKKLLENIDKTKEQLTSINEQKLGINTEQFKDSMDGVQKTLKEAEENLKNVNNSAVNPETEEFKKSAETILKDLEAVKTKMAEINEHKLEMSDRDFKKAVNDAQKQLKKVQEEFDGINKKSKKAREGARDWKDIALPGIGKSINDLKNDFNILATSPGFVAFTALITIITGITEAMKMLNEAFVEYSANTKKFVLKGMTKEEAHEMQDLTHSIVSETGLNSEAVTNSALSLSSFLNKSDSSFEELTIKFTKLQELTGEDAIESSMKAMKSWGIATDDMSEKLDAFYKISRKSGMSMESLMEQVKPLAETMKPFGATIEGTAQMLANINDLDFDDALNNVGDDLTRLMMMSMGESGFDSNEIISSLQYATDKMKELGYYNKKTKQIDIKQFDKIVNSIQTTKDEAEAITLSNEFFGNAQMAKVIRSGAFRNEKEDIMRSNITGDNEINKITEETSTPWDKLNLTLTKLGAAFEPVIIAFGDWLEPKLDDLNDWIDNFLIPVMQNDLVPILTKVFTISTNLYNIIKDVIQTLYNIITTVYKILDFNPLGMIDNVISGFGDITGAVAEGISNVVNNSDNSVSSNTTNNITFEIQSSGNAYEDIARAEQLQNALMRKQSTI